MRKRCAKCNDSQCLRIGEQQEISDPSGEARIETKAYCCLDVPSDYIKKPIGRWLCDPCAGRHREHQPRVYEHRIQVSDNLIIGDINYIIESIDIGRNGIKIEATEKNHYDEKYRVKL